uniref:Uncharacterized protein n=1 Tax=Cacopsylla melanoneura TaxID=428564 RepID=A0A8D9B955_9HEMI
MLGTIGRISHKQDDALFADGELLLCSQPVAIVTLCRILDQLIQNVTGYKPDTRHLYSLSVPMVMSAWRGGICRSCPRRIVFHGIIVYWSENYNGCNATIVKQR